MPKAFLSHSSSDKKKFVDIVARQLGKQRINYDKFTFEEGMKSIEEIEKGLKQSDLFVLFLSDKALNSSWVKKELKMARMNMEEKQLSRIYPIIIDASITHADPRIPKWMKEYNLKYASKPTTVTRRIKQRLREISWNFHPRLKEKEKIFVGRNDLVKQFEERIDSIDLPVPFCVVASGFSKIGRKVFIKHCLRKVSFISDSYEPSTIKLTSHESLEDFIYKLYDLGFSDKIDLSNLLGKTIDAKLEILFKIIKDIKNADEIVFIDDSGCIVTPDREVIGWFQHVLSKYAKDNHLVFCIASNFRLFRNKIFKLKNLFSIEIPELAPKERAGLLKRYSHFEDISLSKENFETFSNLQKGFPEQVYFTVDLIKDLGAQGALDQSYLISDYNFEKVTYLINKFENDEEAMNYLYLLSSFDFISYELIFEVVGNDDYYKEKLSTFIACAICDFLGTNKEYIRVNDTIRDYVRRTKHELPVKYKKKLNLHLEEFLKNYDPEERDVSDILYSWKQALINGKKVDSKYLIPSHFLKTMKELYDQDLKYKEVTLLADRVLENSIFMDDFIKRQILYYLCLSLAKLRDERFKDEVQKIDGADHNFLFGFYYRKCGNNIKALERLQRAVSERKNFYRAQRELVQVYINMEEFEDALNLARQLYEGSPTNHYFIQAYFACLIREGMNHKNEEIINELISNLRKIKSDKAREMYLEANAQYHSLYLNDKEYALSLINTAIDEFPSSIYPLRTKFDIFERYNMLKEMGELIDYFGKNIDKKSHFYNTSIILKSRYLAKIGKKKEAMLVLSNIKHFPDYVINKFKSKIESIIVKY